jgi:hypothetical protein
MTVSPVERPVASAAYGFIRFIGAGLAPYAASRMVTSFNLHVPFYVGAAAVVVGIGVLASGHRFLSAAEQATMGHAAAGQPAPGQPAPGQPAPLRGEPGPSPVPAAQQPEG